VDRAGGAQPDGEQELPPGAARVTVSGAVESPEEQRGQSALRLAWLGPIPTETFGVAYAGVQILRGLARSGVTVDCFTVGDEAEVAPSLRARPGVEIFTTPPHLPLIRLKRPNEGGSVVLEQVARGTTQRRLLRHIAQRHAVRPYSAFYQFAQPELLAGRNVRPKMPPIVMHPQVHAAGELSALWRERRLLRERPTAQATAAAIGTILALRRRRQSRDLRDAELLLVPGRAFGEDLERDCGIDPTRTRFVPNPVDLDRFHPHSERRAGPITLLFFSFMAVRKGVELVVALSHRLADLAGEVRLLVAGAPRWWSDYRPLLGTLNREVATYLGEPASEDVPALYREADAFLQPSHYEPFGLTVAEALASGLPVVMTTAVGAGDEVSSDCARRVAPGDLPAMEAAIRALVSELQADRSKLRQAARGEAERLFHEDQVSARIVQAVSDLAA
jgi:glycosyltransferase involved in cell wall biosynthesis